MNLPRTVILHDPGRKAEADYLADLIPGARAFETKNLAAFPAFWISGGFELTLPLPDQADGTIQGSLDFLGIPFSGCSLTTSILAHSARYLRVPAAGSAKGQPLTVALVSSLVFGVNSDAVEEATMETARLLGLQGGCLLNFVAASGSPLLESIETSPSLLPGSPFCRALEAGGTTLDSALRLILTSGLERCRENNRLVSTFRDQL